MRDSRLIQQILGGDRAAGEKLVTEHYPRVYRFMRQLTGSVECAEDLTQQSFVRAWQALAAFRGEASLSTWLHRIAYHEYTHWLRGRHEHAPLEEAVAVADGRSAGELEAVLLRGALAQLSAEQRETFLLYHVQELSVAEVAVVLEVPAGTVKSRLFMARQRLRQLLGEPGTSASTTGGPQSCWMETKGTAPR